MTTPNSDPMLEQGGDSADSPPETKSGPSGHKQGIDELLARPLPEAYREEWTRLIGEREEEKGAETISVFIFRLGAEWLAIPSERVRKVVRGPAPHTIPHRGGVVLGLISVQGDLVLCVALDRLLEIDTRETNTREGLAQTDVQSCYIVAAGEEGPIAFPVDETHGLHRYRETELHNVPSTLGGTNGALVTAILPWKERAVGCLDAQLLFYAINKSLS